MVEHLFVVKAQRDVAEFDCGSLIVHTTSITGHEPFTRRCSHAAPDESSPARPSLLRACGAACAPALLRRSRAGTVAARSGWLWRRAWPVARESAARRRVG